MKIINGAGFIAMLALVSACGGSGGGSKSGGSAAAGESKSGDGSGGTISVDSDGHCTGDFIAAYNNVVIETKALKRTVALKENGSKIFQQAQVLKNACDHFFPVHANVTCQAVIYSKATFIKSKTLKLNCETAQEVLDLQNATN